ncbi:RNA-binding KH domain-containing protein RCF3-like [Bidens hawaiensis]|uniref:RNA-binding KH domain-containing protein RCF3-like n=1 Tax=Bidens hawaiensis TaxID=980011 RepID=UPI00404AE4A8
MTSQLTPSKRTHDQQNASEPTCFRVLCPANQIANITLSPQSAAKIRVDELVPGCDERVIVVDQETEDDSGLQNALMLVFEKMVEKEETATCLMRLLIVSSQAGPLLESAIKQFASESGSQIQVLQDELPQCASLSDVLVQISGEVNAVRKALQLLSQQLLDHPPRGNDSFSDNNILSHSREDAYRFGGRFGPFTDMLTYRLICCDEKVGGVIGKGGSIVKALKHETGCDIKVLDRMRESDDRVIVISGHAHPDERICGPQDAALRVQERIFRAAPESKAVSAKVIVSAHQIGCILGKGGAVISEMRKSTGAYIRILGKDQTPQYAAENEEIVQINGEFDAVQDALFQITTCLRNHYFRDAFPGFQGHGRYPSMNRFDGGGPPLHAVFHLHNRSDFSHRVPERLPTSTPWGPQGVERFPDFGGATQRRMCAFGGENHQAIITNTTVEVVVPRTVVNSIYGEDGGCLKQIREISDANITITDPKPGAKETLVIISGTPDQTHAAQSLIQAFVICETQVS